MIASLRQFLRRQADVVGEVHRHTTIHAVLHQCSQLECDTLTYRQPGEGLQDRRDMLRSPRAAN